MSELNHPERHDLEQAEKARDAERHVLEERVSKAESPRTEEEHASDAADARAQAQKIEQFRKDFAGVEGMEGVANSASLERHNLNDRNGALHQIDVAYTLGRGNVKAFESHFTAGEDSGYVDIVTTDDIAVECKHSDALYPSTIKKAVEQAESRVESGYFKGAVVVYNDGSLYENLRNHANTNERPDLRICERSELNNVLKKMRAGG